MTKDLLRGTRSAYGLEDVVKVRWAYGSAVDRRQVCVEVVVDVKAGTQHEHHSLGAEERWRGEEVVFRRGSHRDLAEDHVARVVRDLAFDARVARFHDTIELLGGYWDG